MEILGEWDVGNVTKMYNIFNEYQSNGSILNITNKFNEDINDWNVGNVTNMAHMFRGLPILIDPTKLIILLLTHQQKGNLDIF